MADKFYIKIHSATDSFLYLPVYIAKELEIFQTLLGPKRIIKDKKSGVEKEYEIEVVFEKTKSDEGDEEAILNMMKDCTDTSVAIAIGSPVAFLKETITEDIKNVRIVGAIINRLTFWAVNFCKSTKEKYDDRKKLKGKFKKIIYPSEKFVTGCYLGREFQKDTGVSDKNLDPVPFDTEIEKLKLHKHNSCDTNCPVAITADIATLAAEVAQKGTETGNAYELHINHHFSQWGNFLTTGIIASKESCEKFPDIITKIIEAIQKSIAILYSSESTAREICASIATKIFSSKFSPEINAGSEVIKNIIQFMYKEEFYPADLNISKDSWDKAVKALSYTRQWNRDDKNTKHVIYNSFYDFVDNRYVLASERNIAKGFGIDLYTFKKREVVGHIFARPYNAAVTFLFKRYFKVSLFILISLFLIVLGFTYHVYWVDADKITVKDIIFLFLSPFVSLLLTNLITEKKK